MVMRAWHLGFARFRPFKVTCVSDVYRIAGEGLSFLPFHSKQKGLGFPSNFLFSSFYIYNTPHIQTKDQSTYTKTTFKLLQTSQWTQSSTFSITCLPSFIYTQHLADLCSRNTVNSATDTVKGSLDSTSKEANKSTSLTNLETTPTISVH